MRNAGQDKAKLQDKYSLDNVVKKKISYLAKTIFVVGSAENVTRKRSIGLVWNELESDVSMEKTVINLEASFVDASER